MSSGAPLLTDLKPETPTPSPVTNVMSNRVGMPPKPPASSASASSTPKAPARKLAPQMRRGSTMSTTTSSPAQSTSSTPRSTNSISSFFSSNSSSSTSSGAPSHAGSRRSSISNALTSFKRSLTRSVLELLPPSVTSTADAYVDPSFSEAKRGYDMLFDSLRSIHSHLGNYSTQVGQWQQAAIDVVNCVSVLCSDVRQPEDYAAFLQEVKIAYAELSLGQREIEVRIEDCKKRVEKELDEAIGSDFFKKHAQAEQRASLELETREEEAMVAHVQTPVKVASRSRPTSVAPTPTAAASAAGPRGSSFASFPAAGTGALTPAASAEREYTNFHSLLLSQMQFQLQHRLSIVGPILKDFIEIETLVHQHRAKALERVQWKMDEIGRNVASRRGSLANGAAAAAAGQASQKGATPSHRRSVTSIAPPPLPVSNPAASSERRKSLVDGAFRYRMGEMLETGAKGQARDLHRAFDCYVQAAALGYQEAIDKLKDVTFIQLLQQQSVQDPIQSGADDAKTKEEEVKRKGLEEKEVSLEAESEPAVLSSVGPTISRAREEVQSDRQKWKSVRAGRERTSGGYSDDGSAESSRRSSVASMVAVDDVDSDFSL